MTFARTLLGFALLLGLLPSLSAALSAAPPSVRYFFPAGARRGTTVEVTAAGTFEQWPVGVSVQGKGVAVKPAKDKGKLIVTVAADAAPGTCWLRLYDAQGASIARPFVVGLLPEIAEHEPNNEPKQAQKIETANVVVNGRLDKAGDVDTFAVALRQGQTLVAAVEAHRTLRSPMDGVLQILSEDGFVLAQNDDYHGLDPQLAFTAPRDGTFLVRLFAFPSVPDASIRFSGSDAHIYRLTLTTSGFVDYPFPLSVSADHPGKVELIGWNLPEDARRLAVTPKGKDDRLILSHPAIVNPVAVRVEPHFTLALRGATSRTMPQAIPVPATVTSRLDKPSTTDFYQLTARKNQTLAVRVESRGLDFDVEPVLRVTDTAGKQLTRAEAPKLHADAVLSFKPPQDGKYLLEVGDLHNGGGRRHVYRLHVAPAVPDFALTVATDRFTLTPGTPLEIPVTIEKRAGFAEAIMLSIEGLPAGVMAGTVTTKAADKTATLRVNGASADTSVPIRIIGKAQGADGATHFARVAITELDRLTEDLWLTVRKAPKPAPAK